jgi:hypothetical protein
MRNSDFSGLTINDMRLIPTQVHPKDTEICPS